MWTLSVLSLLEVLLRWAPLAWPLTNAVGLCQNACNVAHLSVVAVAAAVAIAVAAVAAVAASVTAVAAVTASVAAVSAVAVAIAAIAASVAAIAAIAVAVTAVAAAVAVGLSEGDAGEDGENAEESNLCAKVFDTRLVYKLLTMS